jgi:hypothetical protein
LEDIEEAGQANGEAQRRANQGQGKGKRAMSADVRFQLVGLQQPADPNVQTPHRTTALFELLLVVNCTVLRFVFVERESFD